MQEHKRQNWTESHKRARLLGHHVLPFPLLLTLLALTAGMDPCRWLSQNRNPRARRRRLLAKLRLQLPPAPPHNPINLKPPHLCRAEKR
ncbi:hypothetical protein CERZMDRAFT_122863 [Cercospora zeae-maydis SCOH1-5]|uniref:Uncharacterized protein n=1 Tax=Cercospora zeae-maydis SCOH1-5 TaxID=717836 RepID=A0A6A6F133_9PEZI|nr:hypothetical protein CERZMDRAFT_122863 [Cercospora zeae-maydis SCOH1-5]